MQMLLKAGLTIVAAALVLAGCGGDPMPTTPAAAPQAYKALAGVPTTATIDSAWVAIHVSRPDTQTVAVHPVLGEWTETELTYAGRPAVDTLDTLAVFTVVDTGWIMIPISGLAADWVEGRDNFGLIFRQADTAAGFVGWDSREAAGLEPYLRLCYSWKANTMCEVFTAVADAYIDEAAPDANFGAAAELFTGRDTAEGTSRAALVHVEIPVYTPPATLGDFVWLDTDRNGVQDDGEPGLASITIDLFACDGDTLVASAATDLSGYYRFDSLAPGAYYIAAALPDSLMYALPDQGGDETADSDLDPATGRSACVDLAPGDDYRALDAGYTLAYAAVGDFVWNDMNENGLQDAGEPGLAGIAVNLFACDGRPVASAVTDSSGRYLFENLEPGDYYLQLANPFGWIFTYAGVGGDDLIDSDVDRYYKTTTCFALSPGEEDYSRDAGLIETDGCTHGKGYWKNHAGFGPQPDEVTRLLLPIYLGTPEGTKTIAVADARTAFDILQQHTYGHPSNGITKLYAHLLTAKLNIVNFANPEAVYPLIDEIDAFLSEYDWNDWEMLAPDRQTMVQRWKGRLEMYNGGNLGPGRCDGDAAYDDDGDSDGDY